MVYYLEQQNIDKQCFSIFLRDLSETLNLNLRYMIEDNFITKKEKNKEGKGYYKGKKVIKKKDLIIQEQNIKKKQKAYEDDLNKIRFFLKEIDLTNPFLLLKKLTTEEGCNAYYSQLLDHFWKDKRKMMHYIFFIYFELQKKDIHNEKTNELSKLFDKYDSKLFMMKEMDKILPPLDYWNQKEKTFEEWQKKTITRIQQNKSILVKAPTSSGKSFIAMSAGIFHKRILYVCPAKPVAYQVGAHFMHMGYKVHFLVNNHSNYSYDSKTNIFIGTPYEIENNIYKIGTSFDYAIFDEIHNVNREKDGDTYENLIKLIKCNFLALSATVKNINFLRDCFQKIHPTKEIQYIEYNKRFINQQRWIWKENKLIKLHPFCAYKTIEDIEYDTALPFTPFDCGFLWERIEETFEEIGKEEIIEDCSPDEYFPENRLLTLDDCKEYECFLKKKLKEIHQSYPNEVQKIIDIFTVKSNGNEDVDHDIVQFIQTVKNEDMFPMIMFHTEEEECKKLFNKLYKMLDNQEIKDYPYHYEILKKKQEYYENYNQKKETYRNSINVLNSTNPEYLIQSKMETYDKNETRKYITYMHHLYQTKINEIQKREGETQMKGIQIKNLRKEMKNFIENPDLCPQDIFQKHKEFIFTKSNKPMDADTIRNIRNEIKKTLRIKIPYEAPILQMLKRGIGIYTENMPDEYNWILQKLLANKEIGIVISDRTLCLGIDLPVRTSCFMGLNNNNNNNIFNKEDYLQMSGRAGRRGMDNQGNIIFYGNIDYVSLMKGELPNIQGNSRSINGVYNLFSGGDDLFQNMINTERKVIHLTSQLIQTITHINNKKLIWALRNINQIECLCIELPTIERKMYTYDKQQYLKEKYLLNLLQKMMNMDITHIYQSKKICTYQELNILKKFLELIINIYNNLNYSSYKLTMDTLKTIFDSLNHMAFTFII